MRARVATVLLGGMTSVAAACDGPAVLTARRQVELTAEPSIGSFASGGEIVVGSRVCPRMRAVRESDDPVRFVEADESEIAACYALGVEGPGIFDEDGCLALPSPGRVVLTLDRRPCALAGDFGDDALELNVVALADVRGAFSYAVPTYAGLHAYAEALDEDLEIEVPSEDLPGVVAKVGDPVYVLEGEPARLQTKLMRVHTTDPVAFTDAIAIPSILAGSPTFSPQEDPTEAFGYTAVSGDAFHVALQLPEGRLEVGEVHIVSPSAIASITVAPTMLRFVGTDQFFDLGAVVVARAADGTVLRRPRARWSKLDGPGQLDSWDFDEEPREYAQVTDACEGAQAGEWREATLQAQIGPFTDAAAVRWQCVEGDAPGCGCRAPGGGGLTWLWGLLLVAIPRGRRRRSSG